MARKEMGGGGGGGGGGGIKEGGKKWKVKGYRK